jgi:hypothetical protein
MVKYSKGQLVQYTPYHGAAHTSKPQNQGRILDPIIDATNTFTGAYVVCTLIYIPSSIFLANAGGPWIGSERESYEADGASCSRGGYHHVVGAIHDVNEAKSSGDVCRLLFLTYANSLMYTIHDLGLIIPWYSLRYDKNGRTGRNDNTPCQIFTLQSTHREK